MKPFVFTATIAATVGSGLIAGSFFVFSVAVMPALRRQPAAESMAAMNRINEVILNAAFLGVFLGTALICLGLSAWSVWEWSSSGSAYLLTGSLLYLIGSFGVTVAFNVPLNNSLADLSDPSLWETWAASWTFWNHIRTIASTIAVAAFTLAAAHSR